MLTGEAQRRGGFKAALVLTVLFVAMAIGMALPRVDRLTTATVGDYADGYFVQWAMAWDVHALAENPRGIFDANIFWPATNVLAYSDNLIPPAIVVGALRLWDDEAALNLVYLATWIVSLAGMYLLTMWFLPNRAAAVLAAIVFTFAAPRLGDFGHFQLTFACLLPYPFYLYFRFKRDTKLWQAVLLALVTAVTALTALYYGVFLGVAFVVLFLLTVALDRKAVTLKFVGGLALAGAITLLMTAPVGYKYLQLQEDPHFVRDPAEKSIYSAVPKDLITPARHSYLYSKLISDRTDRRDVQLFPGAIASVLGLAGLTALLARKGEGFRLTHKRDLAVLACFGLVFLLLSFGRNLDLGRATIPMPYEAIDELPTVASIRVVSRFFVFSLMVIGCLTGIGFAWVTSRFSAKTQIVIAVLIGGLMLSEYATLIRMVPEISSRNAVAVNLELSRRPHGNVLELPIHHPREFLWGHVEAPRMYLSRLDWKPRINGYSGFYPPEYEQKAASLRRLENGPPVFTDALEALESLKVRYVVIRTAPITPELHGAAPHIPGLTFYDEATTARVVAAIPPEMVVRTGRYGDAVLIELRVRQR